MKLFGWTFGIVFTILIAAYSVNYFSIIKPVQDKAVTDYRNNGISIRVNFKWYCVPTTLSFDLTEVSENKAPMDVFRVLLQTAEALKDKNFEKVELSYQGKAKFLLKGSYFKKLGQQYEFQNPMYTVRTFAENVYNLNGERAFEEWSGGILAVMGRQMEDFNTFTDRWYKAELTNR